MLNAHIYSVGTTRGLHSVSQTSATQASRNTKSPQYPTPHSTMPRSSKSMGKFWAPVLALAPWNYQQCNSLLFSPNRFTLSAYLILLLLLKHSYCLQWCSAHSVGLFSFFVRQARVTFHTIYLADCMRRLICYSLLVPSCISVSLYLNLA